MGKTWVLSSETKGTGAHVAPLSEPADAPRREDELALVTLDRGPRPIAAPEPPASLRFKVVDVMGARVVGEDVSMREAVALLSGARSVLDVRISVWEPSRRRWRILSLPEAKSLWRFRREE
jgi:hypothetical protein